MPEHRTPEVINQALRCLEEAGDRAARKGADSESLLQGMLSIYVASRLGFGSSPEEVLDEVVKAMTKFIEEAPKAKVEIGPPLGEGDN